MNDTLDRTMYKVAQHVGMAKLEETLKNDLKSAISPTSELKDDSIYCSCQPPDFEEVDDGVWYCMNCEKEAEPYEPLEDEETGMIL